MDAPRIRLGHFRLSAYRSCQHTAFEPHPRLTALIGPNGSGKTNVLHGLLLLRDASPRRRYMSDDRDIFTLRCRIEATFVVNARAVPYRASIVFRPTDRNRDDVLEIREKFNFKSIDHKDEWIDPLETMVLHSRHYPTLTTRRPTQRQHTASHVVRTPDGRYIVLDPSSAGTRPRPSDNRVVNALHAIQDFRSRISYYSASQFTNPSLCPTSFEIDSSGDLRDTSIRGTTHIRFMYDLYKKYETDPDAYANYMGLVGKGGLSLIDKIAWKRSTAASNSYEVRSGGTVVKKKRNTILIIPTVHAGQSQLSLNQLSEGTFRSLAMLFYIITGQSSMLLLEEPEVCVHHGLLASFVEVMKQYSKYKQMIISTHSDYVIDKLHPENVLLVRNDPARGTTVRPISKAMSTRQYAALKEYLRTIGNLGEYWRHSGFGS